MKNKYYDIFCTCGEYIAIKNLETEEIEVDSEVECCQIKDERVSCVCPYCSRKHSINGKLIPL